MIIEYANGRSVKVEDEEDGETRLRVSTRVSPIPMKGMIEIPGIRVVPSGRQICGVHPVDPRFYIREAP